MSVQAITWALEQRTRSATHKAVLLVLANRLDPTGFGWPSQKRVAVEAQCSDRTVRRVLADMEADGLLVRSDRRRPDGSYSTDEIQFAMPISPAENLAAGPADNLTSGQSGRWKQVIENVDQPADNLTDGQIDQRSDCPDSLRLNQKKKKEGSRHEPTPNLPEAIASYDEAAKRCGWVRLREFTENRRIAARACWRRLGGLEGWRRLLAEAERQSFLGGENDRGWRMDFDFFVSPKGGTHILEGKYLKPAERDAFNREAALKIYHEHGYRHPQLTDEDVKEISR